MLVCVCVGVAEGACVHSLINALKRATFVHKLKYMRNSCVPHIRARCAYAALPDKQNRTEVRNKQTNNSEREKIKKRIEKTPNNKQTGTICVRQ